MFNLFLLAVFLFPFHFARFGKSLVAQRPESFLHNSTEDVTLNVSATFSAWKWVSIPAPLIVAKL